MFLHSQRQVSLSVALVENRSGLEGSKTSQSIAGMQTSTRSARQGRLKLICGARRYRRANRCFSRDDAVKPFCSSMSVALLPRSTLWRPVRSSSGKAAQFVFSSNLTGLDFSLGCTRTSAFLEGVSTAAKREGRSQSRGKRNAFDSCLLPLSLLLC